MAQGLRWLAGYSNLLNGNIGNGYQKLVNIFLVDDLEFCCGSSSSFFCYKC